MIPGDERPDISSSSGSKKTHEEQMMGYSSLLSSAAQSPAPSEQSLGSGRLTVDAGFLNDDSSVDFDSPKCSPGKSIYGSSLGWWSTTALGDFNLPSQQLLCLLSQSSGRVVWDNCINCSIKRLKMHTGKCSENTIIMMTIVWPSNRWCGITDMHQKSPKLQCKFFWYMFIARVLIGTRWGLCRCCCFWGVIMRAIKTLYSYCNYQLMRQYSLLLGCSLEWMHSN